MHTYRVYGLGLHSEIAFPELLTSPSSPADVVVARGEVSVEPSQGETADDSWAERRADTNETRCVFSGVGRFAIRDGRSIVVDPDPAADVSVVRHLLLGPVLAHLLWQRDIFTLHASVVSVHGRHVAFVGVSGEGKSTTAAALEAAGHRLVCDDVAALVEEDARLRVLPGFPRIRLHDDAISGIGERPEAHPVIHPHIEKRSKSVAGFATESVLLDRLYVLASGDDFGFAPLSPSGAVMEVLRHTYYAHQYAPLYGFPQHLARASRVVSRVAAYRLTRPKDLARLPELVGCIEAHAAT
jgi:hypothetical protein